MATISLLSITPAILSTLIWTTQRTLANFPFSPCNSPISPFFLLLNLLPALPATSPSSPLSFGIANDDSRTNTIPTAYFNIFTFLPYPPHYKPQVLWHTKPCVFSKPINNITCNISKNIKETDPNLSASPASSTFLLYAATYYKPCNLCPVRSPFSKDLIGCSTPPPPTKISVHTMRISHCVACYFSWFFQPVLVFSSQHFGHFLAISTSLPQIFLPTFRLIILLTGFPAI